MKILRDQPATLQCAVAVATNEQNLRACVQMSHHSGYRVSMHKTHRMHSIHLWRLTTQEVNDSRLDLDLIGSTALGNRRIGVGVVARLVT